MLELKRFSIPIKGLKDGMHEFDFQIDSLFFNHFEASPIQKGQFDLKVFFDKRPDMIVLTFDLKGSVKTECDRCLADINLPVKGSPQLLVKYAEQESEDAEVIYILRERDELNIARYAYEFICLSLPIIKIFDCKNDDKANCNEEMLQYLADAEKEKSENPIWDELKNFNQNN